MSEWSTEPFIDWDALDDEMAKDLHQYLCAFRQAQADLAECEEAAGQQFRALAANLLRTQEELSGVVGAIRNALYTVPMVVHVAGAKSASYEDGQEQVIQRCKRCGSVLQVWTEGLIRMTPGGPSAVPADDMVWWKEGETVAKSASDDRQIYRIDENRELEDFERPCPDLTALGT